MTTGRVYLYFGEDYRNYNTFWDFNALIKAVAYSNRYANGKWLVKTDGDREQLCERNTKLYIANEATNLIRRITPIYDNHHMALHASKRQINELIKVCEHKGNRLSCYSLVMLHIIYISINNAERDRYKIKMNELNLLIHQVANEVLRHNRNNIMAQYLVACHPLIDREANEDIIPNVADFPATHRWF